VKWGFGIVCAGRKVSPLGLRPAQSTDKFGEEASDDTRSVG
jgi:hypothetical protein